jgi:hypothetical protein
VSLSAVSSTLTFRHGSKRFPKAHEFSLSNEDHLNYLILTTNLFGQIFRLNFKDDEVKKDVRHYTDFAVAKIKEIASKLKVSFALFFSLLSFFSCPLRSYCSSFSSRQNPSYTAKKISDGEAKKDALSDDEDTLVKKWRQELKQVFSFCL